MATRKQRKRMQKERRHEYETVWLDSEGNELEEPPDDAPAAPRQRRADGKKPDQKRPQRSSRTTRTPLPPSWRRAYKRTLIWAVPLGLLFVFLQASSKHPQYLSAVFLIVLVVLFYPLALYQLDKFAYNRWQKSQAGKKG